MTISAKDFLSFINSFLGIPYIWGGKKAATGLDCSGLVQQLLRFLQVGPQDIENADSLYRYFLKQGKGQVVDTAVLGDLVFYGQPNHVIHVAMAVGDAQVVEAAHGGPSCTTKEIANSLGAKTQIDSINRHPGLVAVIRPSGVEWSA